MKKSTVRTIYDITIAEEEGYLRMTFHGNGFLQNMVRILTGTLLEVGYGRMHAEDMETVLASRDRQMAGPTAPPHGLMLLEVEYEMSGYLIKDTTREEREQIVAESLGNIEATCDGCMSGLAEMYQDYIDGKKELREINMEFNARYVKGEDMPQRSRCPM